MLKVKVGVAAFEKESSYFLMAHDHLYIAFMAFFPPPRDFIDFINLFSVICTV